MNNNYIKNIKYPLIFDKKDILNINENVLLEKYKNIKLLIIK